MSKTKKDPDVVKFCSEPQSAGDFKAMCFALIGKDTISHPKKAYDSPESVAESLGLDEDDVDTAKELIGVCSPENLRCALEDKYHLDSFESAKDFPDEITHLSMLRHMKHGYKRPEDVNHLVPKDADMDIDDNSPNLGEGEVLLSVAMFLPARVISSKRHKNQEYLVVAKQHLTDLRDKLHCVADYTLTGECSENPDLKSYEKPMDTYRSGFFFIEGVFYNDMRDPYNRDYSKVIIKWAKSGDRWKSPGLGIFKSKRMEETRFGQLKIRLGYPYLYCHQGNCEHIIIFTDMRLIQPEDPQRLSSYPHIVFKDKPKRKKCSICEILTARWVLYGDMLAFEEPGFFCQQCLENLHYDEDGKKLYSFEAYPYDGTHGL